MPKNDRQLPGIRIDFGATGQSVQSNWSEWSASGDDVTILKSFSADFDNDFSIKLTNVDWRIRKPVDTSVEPVDLIEDAVKNSSTFLVTFKDLNPGTYEITTYHHDPNEADGTLDIDVEDADGSRKTKTVLQSGGTNPSNIATATFQFRCDGNDVILRITDNDDGGKSEAFLSGIMLQ